MIDTSGKAKSIAAMVHIRALLGATVDTVGDIPKVADGSVDGVGHLSLRSTG